MDKPRNIAQTGGRPDQRMHGLARGGVNRRHAHVVSGVPHDLGRCVGVVHAHIGQQNMFADPNPPRDGLTDQTSSDHDNYIFHSFSSCVVNELIPKTVCNLGRLRASRVFVLQGLSRLCPFVAFPKAHDARQGDEADQSAVYPASTARVAPLAKEAASDRNHMAASPISVGSAKRPIGDRESMSFWSSAKPGRFSANIGVSTGPISRVFTRIWSFAKSAT